MVILVFNLLILLFVLLVLLLKGYDVKLDCLIKLLNCVFGNWLFKFFNCLFDKGVNGYEKLV